MPPRPSQGAFLKVPITGGEVGLCATAVGGGSSRDGVDADEDEKRSVDSHPPPPPLPTDGVPPRNRGAESSSSEEEDSSAWYNDDGSGGSVMYGQMPPGEEMLMPGAIPLPPAAEDTEALIAAAADRERQAAMEKDRQKEQKLQAWKQNRHQVVAMPPSLTSALGAHLSLIHI